MAVVQKSIEVEVPLSVAYNQWTQFEEFPRFMKGVEEVQQLDDRHLHWIADIAGKREEWDAQIEVQIPDRQIQWSSIDGAMNAGIVTFAPLGANRTQVNLEVDYVPESLVESVGDALGFMDRQVEGDLDRFKQFIESRGRETGAWRGQIP
jgi:uncharacterized membrane protein